MLVGDRSAAFDFVQPSSRTRDWRYPEWPRMGATGLLRVSRDPARTGPLAEHPVTDVLRTCNHARNDGRCLDGRANNAARGDANVRAYGHAKRRYYRLHPQPALARRRRPISSDWAGPIQHGRVHENKVVCYCHRRACSHGRSGKCTTPDDRSNTCPASAACFAANPSIPIINRHLPITRARASIVSKSGSGFFQAERNRG
jgi:hypothetical protein